MVHKHDIIIIGSGLGGLTCGYILAKNGYRVTILEKNAQLGGCLQTFSRQGVKFETGMHYIGSMDKGETLYKFFNYLDLLKDVQLSRLDTTAYDIISIGDERFPFANGAENFVRQLSEFFPKERTNLENYYRTIADVAQKSPLYSLNFSNEQAFLVAKYIQQSAGGFIDSVTGNKLLQSVLSGTVPLYAGERDKTPFYIHALINDFYNKSAFRIIGGSDAITKSLVASIRKMGGTVITNAEVTNINCNESQAVSVSLKNGETLSGDYFISNVHPMRMIELVDSHLIRKAYRHRIERLDNTAGNFTVYLKFKPNTVKYCNSNVFHYESPEDVWRGGNYTSETWGRNFLYMHLCSSENQAFADGAILMTYMNFDDVAQWQGTKIERRGADYQLFKQRKAERLLSLLERKIPDTLANIETFYTSTPLTYLDYTGTERGSMYGILRDCTEPMQTLVSQRTKIPNLFQTGQNINSHGILGVIIGSIITSAELLGINTIIEQIKGNADL
ncbi:all-trans-retinol 13,14-reductase [Bacteroidia bacterium]|nr:all-trans-retinol 13,14-reductase [Bacteroidia bacterium]